MSGENCNTTLRSPSHRRPVRLIALITSGLLSLMAVGLAQPAQAVGTPGQGDTSFNSYFGYPLVSGGVNALKRRLLITFGEKSLIDTQSRLSANRKQHIITV